MSQTQWEREGYITAIVTVARQSELFTLEGVFSLRVISRAGILNLFPARFKRPFTTLLLAFDKRSCLSVTLESAVRLLDLPRVDSLSR